MYRMLFIQALSIEDEMINVLARNKFKKEAKRFSHNLIVKSDTFWLFANSFATTHPSRRYSIPAIAMHNFHNDNDIEGGRSEAHAEQQAALP